MIPVHMRMLPSNLFRGVPDTHADVYPADGAPRRHCTTNIPTIYGKHHAFRPKTPIYNEVSAHASTDDSIQTNTRTLIDP